MVLLHGLSRRAGSMNRMEQALQEKGFRTCNISYPSTRHKIEVLAKDHVLPEIEACVGDRDTPLDFVTHSMGGILVRYLAEHQLVNPVGRVVMLSPPNQGSEVVDRLGENWLFNLVNGPAGKELGTDDSSMPLQLGPAGFELGVITGNRTINLFLSMMIDGSDDGKVSVKRAAVDGMQDMIVLPTAHPFIMKNRRSISQTLYFLENGVFQRTLSLGASQ
ncbi:MAG: alpha/beta hydrolase [Bacteroidetes Order II. Incertae sedis bacterium]|nr:alpha/beta hydrolase [Bacteroidetes Order II. bacterium]MBT4052009.1 alpha/beta hydrolase [Bacteroidetes Order II. bacterium]MBT4602596.1 alpha/beta hydrolase [Bacteroidetes Order II. bacterium]MBT5249843.1 alpha/beta hydrolase [Bacteroidetes Order II. bacterium]MBT6199262.1 alpha/beta hydrolase [Bacteroidetes Order II. bacterium]